ncbi:uncharacterized protein LOC8065156 [Sorghum bicolor]|uniref:DUF538 family protein n=1 Tax=Sorghum bicolor TaxID=4558 RepID=C5WVD2_SORBI|nr:uncharacterized protein LOC8065156 [Sorghum bicolor]EER91364.1 hypothetical protein SORBI_3001G193400 [Sorghum bicolor]|eukprot:XP_002464366.1 uncharacterized protein LOC8065156 [Sorghum bicolor]
MASLTVSTATAAAAGGNKSKEQQREGAEIITGAEACFAHSKEMLKSLGFPGGVMPLRGLEECGWVRETGFVWMRQKAPYEHYFRGTGTRVRYDAEVTAYVEEGRMKRMTGVRSKQVMLWVPIVEMSLDGDKRDKIYFKSNVGIGRSFPASAFPDEDEEAAEPKKKKEEEKKEEEENAGDDDKSAADDAAANK